MAKANESTGGWTVGPLYRHGGAWMVQILDKGVPIAYVETRAAGLVDEDIAMDAAGEYGRLIACAPELATLLVRMRTALDVVLSERVGYEPAWLTETMNDAHALLARIANGGAA